MAKIAGVVFLLLFFGPLAASALRYGIFESGFDWWRADRSSAGVLPAPSSEPGAMVRVLSAPTVSWRGIFATHSWLVLKEAGAGEYERFDYTAWGAPVRRNGFAADGRWFGRAPRIVFSADGEPAARAIPGIRAAIATFAFRNPGDYRPWPGPNSNTFVAAALAGAPELGARLPNTAIGRDYPYDGRWFTADARGLRVTLGGYAGFAIGRTGAEINLLGGVLALDVSRPAVELPGLGRFGAAPAR